MSRTTYGSPTHTVLRQDKKEDFCTFIRVTESYHMVFLVVLSSVCHVSTDTVLHTSGPIL